MTSRAALQWTLLGALFVSSFAEATYKDPAVRRGVSKMARAVERAIRTGEPRPLGMKVKRADGRYVAILPVGTHVGYSEAERRKSANDFAKRTDFDIFAERPYWGVTQQRPVQSTKARGKVTTVLLDAPDTSHAFQPKQGMLPDALVDEAAWDKANAERNVTLRSGRRRGF